MRTARKGIALLMIGLTLLICMETGAAEAPGLEAPATGGAGGDAGQRESAWSAYAFPPEFDYEPPFAVTTDGRRFRADFNPQDYKNAGEKTYYVSANGSKRGGGLQPESACTLVAAYERAKNGDTIVMLEGDYDRSNTAWGTTVIRKSINIIGQGTVRLFAGLRSPQLKFEKTAGRDSVYQTTQSNAVSVIDYASESGKYHKYALVPSLADCEGEEGTYFMKGSTVYVHAIGHGDPTGRVMLGMKRESFFDVDNNAKGGVRVYLENIQLIGKAKGLTVNRAAPKKELSAVIVDCKFFHCGSPSDNSISLYGGFAAIVRCEVLGSGKDGVSYNGRNKAGKRVTGNYVEIGCTIEDSGLGHNAEAQNASTGHSGAKIVRINGRYRRSFGAVVADVMEGTQSVNLGCDASDSVSAAHGEGFSAQQPGAKMWLAGCSAFGNTYDLLCVQGAAMYVSDCMYASSMKLGSFFETNG